MQYHSWVTVHGMHGSARVADMHEGELVLVKREIEDNPSGFVGFSSLVPGVGLYIRASEILALDRNTPEVRAANDAIDAMLCADHKAAQPERDPWS